MDKLSEWQIEKYQNDRLADKNIDYEKIDR